jgi:long-chain fatty acid transport protein
MFKKTKLVAGITLATATLISQQISAAGFAVNEQSATASGTALAGNAASDTDISFSYWNPALFANATETKLYINGSYVMPSVEMSNQTATNNATRSVGSPTSYTSTQGSSDPSESAVIPSIYLAVPLNDKTVVGVSLNVPYAISSDYDDDWAGKYHATKTELQDISLSLSAAYRVNEWVDVGASIQAHSTSMTLEAEVIDADQDGYGSQELEDDLSFGWSVGIAMEPQKGTRIGLGYRSEVDVEQKGEVDFSNINASVAASAGLVDANITADNTLPSLLTLSLEQELADNLTLGLTAMRTGWSSVQALDIDYDNATTSLSNSTVTLNYKDVWFYSAGLTYDYSEDLILRTGYAIDNSPSDPNNLSARAPGSDRQWITFGGTYNVSESTQVMFSYIHLTSDPAKVDKDGASTGEDASRGSFSADYDISANIFALAVNTTF